MRTLILSLILASSCRFALAEKPKTCRYEEWKREVDGALLSKDYVAKFCVLVTGNRPAGGKCAPDSYKGYVCAAGRADLVKAITDLMKKEMGGGTQCPASVSDELRRLILALFDLNNPAFLAACGYCPGDPANLCALLNASLYINQWWTNVAVEKKLPVDKCLWSAYQTVTEGLARDNQCAPPVYRWKPVSAVKAAGAEK